MSVAEVVEAVAANAAALVGLDWRPFDRTATLHFRTHEGGRLGLRLEGVHLFAARQSLLVRWGYIPLGEEHWEDWQVHYFGILTGGEFLERFLGQRLGLPSHVVLYDLGGVAIGSGRFVCPVHVTLVTGGGHLDAVCEAVKMLGPHSVAQFAAEVTLNAKPRLRDGER
jgi:hypothetical protein